MDMNPIDSGSSHPSLGFKAVATKSLASGSGSLPVIVQLGSSKHPKSDFHYLGQYNKLHRAMGALGDSERLELVNIMNNAADMMRKGGSFDAETMANAASVSLKETLMRRGVDLKDALKGMALIFQDGRSHYASLDYSQLV